MSLGVLPTSMVMRDALDGTELTRLDLVDLERTYGFPYLVIHRSDLHGLFLRACRRAGVDLRTDQRVTGYATDDDIARVELADGTVMAAPVVIAADGLHSPARRLLVDDQPVSSSYVAYRAAVPRGQVGRDVDLSEVAVYVGPGCHFVHYGLRSGELLNQVAVFRSPKALAGEDDWGTPDELDDAFAATCEEVRQGIPLMGRDRWWRMFDRDPIMNWLHGRIALLGDSAHPPLQYLAQGAVMAIEDGWVLAEHVGRHGAALADDPDVDWDVALAAYNAVRPEHCRRVVLTARAWGDLWHLDGPAREQRNAVLRGRRIRDYSFTDWLYGPTALVPEDEPEPYRTLPLGEAARPRS
jgi:3-hydroxybenzoate 6-monooxygenase